METATFETETGVRVPAVTAAEMASVDRVAVEEFGLQLLQMMENAGRNLAGAVRDVSGGPVAVVAGNGGNGGGGMACARHLANRGVDVRVILDRDSGDLDGAAATQYRILEAMDVPVMTGDPEFEAEVVVDALVGYGLSGALRGTARTLVEAIDRAEATVVSLDVPTGRDATTGEKLGVAVDPDRILTLALPKTGLEDLDAPIDLADISVPAGVYDRLGIDYENPFEDSYVVGLRRERAE